MERLMPDEIAADSGTTGEETLQLHLERYQFAARHARPGRLLDMACGVGYGSHLLAQSRKDITELVAVDLSAQAIAYARNRYIHPNVRFRAHDAMTFQDDAGFDTIVSLETIEHVPDPCGLVRRLTGLLRAEGMLICSVPVTPSTDANPHHLHDFTVKSFRRMFAGLGLDCVASLSQIQPYSVAGVVSRREKRMQHMRRNLPAYYLRHPASALRRVLSTLTDGFNNKYLTLAWQRGK
jgi:trans-aconitate methyltransferase